jgi:hypothetical protein
MSSILIVLLLHHHVYVIYTNSLVTPSLVLCVICFVDCCLTLLGVTDSDCSFGYLLSIVLSLPLGSYRFRLLLWVSFVHCVVSPCLSYRFWLPFWLSSNPTVFHNSNFLNHSNNRFPFWKRGLKEFKIPVMVLKYCKVKQPKT